MKKFKVHTTIEVDESIEIEAESGEAARLDAEDEVFYNFKQKYPDLRITNAVGYYVEEL